MKKLVKKRGELLIGNVIFIILNLIFLTILVVFIIKQGSGAVSLEQSYSKQIALIVDSAKPGMKIEVDMQQARNSNKEWYDSNYFDTVVFTDNLVTVKLSEESGYSYSFFNDVKVSYDIYPEGKLLMVVSEK